MKPAARPLRRDQAVGNGMDNRGIARQFGLIFAFTFVTIFVLLKANVVEHIAYEAEKGRMRAVRQSVPTHAELARNTQAARDAARLVMPAVVFIEVQSLSLLRSIAQRQGDDAATSQPADGNEQSPIDGPGWLERHPWAITGEGSGFIIDADRGLILTNNHVIDGADTITVQLPDGRRFEATVLGADPETDLAVIDIDADRLHDVEFGDSDRIEVGDDVLALGNPFGLAGTVSRGIVSAKGRWELDIPGSGIVYRGFLQTDAWIVPGNSGGPLVNLRGEVVGVNTAIATRTGRYDGVGFAIPASRVTALLPSLMRGERVVRGFLGIRPRGVTELPRRSAELGWTDEHGVLVDVVEPESAADTAGLLVDDILLEIDGTELEHAEQLFETLGAMAPGTEITLTVWRGGETITIRATLGSRPT